ncbi:MAG: RNA polymerase sigma factor [Bacteroidales bacterium]|nr:RNA polymerase sigma factor [Bacteroidales bacterium]
MLNEEQLIQGCIKNKRGAQKQLFDKYASVLLGVCMRYARNRDEAEDILQDGFVKIFMRIKQYTGKGSFEGWMKRVMVNTALSFYRQNLKHYYHQDIDEVSELKFDEASMEESEFSEEEIMEIIKNLPDGFRIVFNLYAIEGYKHREIAELLGIDVNTSKSQYSRAKKMIQNRLLELNKEEYYL